MIILILVLVDISEYINNYKIKVIDKMTIDNYPFNLNERMLYKQLKEQKKNIDALNSELITNVQIAQPSGTNSVQVKVVKEDETSIDSNTVTITQPTE